MNTLQYPSGIHICVTLMHTKPGVADNFINDVETFVKEIMKNPGKPVEGKMAIYGMSQTIPDRSIVGDFTRIFLDSLTFTPKKPKKIQRISLRDNKQESIDLINESNDVTLMNE